MKNCAKPLRKLQWVIVGGGLQGCYFAALLSHHYRDVAILDSQSQLLWRWLQRSRSCRMKYMRSTSMHHLAPNPGDLLDFARIRGYGSEHFAEPYLRPSLTLFNAHCQEVLHSFHLNELHIYSSLQGLQRSEGAWHLACSQGELSSENVLLALGDQGECWGNFTATGKVWHLSDPKFSLDEVLSQVPQDPSAVNLRLVGGGISAAQLALHLLEKGLRIQQDMRYPLRSFQFDSEPGWLFKYLPEFQAKHNLLQRWEIIAAERHKGSVPPQLYKKLQDYAKDGCLVSHPEPAPPIPTILATGLEYYMPSWLLDLGHSLDLPLLVTEQGTKPALQDSLEWDAKKAPGLYLCGRLGEIFLGPTAGNIGGARVAARHLPVSLEHSGSFLS